MRNQVQKKFAALEQRRKKILDRLASLSQDRLNYKVDPDKWSIIEVIEHLVLVEQEMVNQASIRGPRPQSAHAPQSREALEMVLEILERDVRVPVPAAGMEPDGQIRLEILQKQWTQAREQLREFFLSLPPEKGNALIFSHPVAGALSVLDMLDLANVHADYHIRQIERIQIQYDKNSSSKTE